MAKTFPDNMPNPTPAQLESPVFQAIWDTIKDWDVNVPAFYEGYCGANGSHVVLLLDALGDVRHHGRTAAEWEAAYTADRQARYHMAEERDEPDANLVKAVEALRKYGSHKGAGTDGGCCMWNDECWCGYGVELQELEVAAGLPVTNPVQDARST